MKTNKTLSQAWEVWAYEPSTQEEIDFQKEADGNENCTLGFAGGWNAALASVVDEPVLTEEDLIKNLEAYGHMTPKNVARLLLSAGRIPASNPKLLAQRHDDFQDLLDDVSAWMGKPGEDDRSSYEFVHQYIQKNPASTPTPQQEVGLTREWLMEGWNNEIDEVWLADVWTRHTQALEAKEAEYDSRIEAIRVSFVDSLAQRDSIMTRQKEELTTLRAELAEAKKGRYAIGQSVTVETVPGASMIGRVVILGMNGNIITTDKKVIPDPEPTPTVEQMTKEILSNRYARTSVTSVEDVCAELIQEIANGATVESLWRRDCKGGVK